MQIQIGKYYVNKTWKYLLPTVKSYGTTFLGKYSSLFKLAVGIYDASFNGKDEDEKLLFILFDKKVKPALFENILNWFKYQPYYFTDYCFDDMETGRMHMVVFRIYEEWHQSYELFKESKYSIMYSQQQIDFLFRGLDTNAVDVLNRTDAAYQRMIENVKISFGTDITRQDLIGGELEFPIEKFKEIFNYNLVNQTDG